MRRGVLSRGGVARAVLAAAALCLLLQGLAATVGLKPSASQGLIGSPTAVSYVAHCLKSDDAGVPAQNRCDHADCCILCGSAGRNAAVVALAIAFFVADYTPPVPASALQPFFPSAPPVGDSAGRNGAWSSRAPPSFS